MTAIPESSCSYCFDEVDPDGDAVLVSVNGKEHPYLEHRFHLNCIKPWAIQHGNCPLCRLNITHINGIEIPRPLSLADAATKNDLTGVENALARADLLEQDCVDAIHVAAQNGLKDIVLAILGYRPDLLGQGVISAVSGAQEVLISTLLSRGPISPFIRETALLDAVVQSNVAIVSLLLNSGKVSNDAFVDLIRSAATLGSLETIRTLVEYAFLVLGDITESFIALAIERAEQEGHAEVVQFLACQENFLSK